MKTHTLLSVFALAAASAVRADLVQITPAAAYAVNAYTGRDAGKAINGSGLADGLHNASAGDMWMGADGKAEGRWWMVDLGAVYDVGRIKVWNFNQSGNSNRGLQSVDFLASTAESVLVADAPDFTDTATWTTFLDDVTLPQAPGAANYAGCDPINLATPVLARWIAVSINTGWGGGYGGLSEIQFFEAPNYTPALSGVTVSSATSASFTGSLVSLDGTSADLYAAYGTTDGGEDAAAWDSIAWIAREEPGEIEETVTGLSPDTGYVLRLAVPNGQGGYTFSAPAAFMTGAISVSPPRPFFKSDPGSKSLVFTRPADCAAVETSFAYTLSGDAAADYASALSGTAVFPAGATSVSVPFTPVNDSAATGDRSVTVTVSAGSGYLTDATSSGTFTVRDDESAAASAYVWSGLGGDMDWNTSGNWTPNGVPSYLDTVTIGALGSTNAPVLSSGGNAAGKLYLGNAAGVVGALDIAAGCGFAVKTETIIGGSGTGAFTAGTGSDVIFNSHPVYIGKNAGGIGSAVVDGTFGLTSGKNLYIGDAGTGEFVVGPNGNATVGVSGQSGHTYIGNAATGVGTVRVNGGSYSVGYVGVVGQNGTGYVFIDGGTMTSPSKYGLRVGGNAGGTGFVEVRGGGNFTCESGSYNQIGYNGTGTVHVINGNIAGRGISIGDAATAVGTLVIEEDGTFSTGTTGYNLFVGNAGCGTLRLRGATGTFSKNGRLVIRNAATAFGLLSGWGSFSSWSSATVNNNGLVIADGEGEDRDLSIVVPGTVFENAIENDGTNGWYAVSGGRLYLKNAATLAAGADGVYTWGEAQTDAEIDLVNSARIGLTNITSKIGSLAGYLYATDRDDVPALPENRDVIGVWRFTANGAFDSFDLEVRYDHVAAQKGQISLYRYDETASAWKLQQADELPGSRVKASGLAPQGADKLGFFMVVATPKPTLFMIF